MTYNLEEAIKILERTPQVLNAFLTDLPEAWTHCNEGPETWSAFDIVGHLIHGEKTDWITRLHLILESDGVQTFQSFDRFAQFEASKGKSLHDLLDEFEVLRSENLRKLKSSKLSPGDFNKKAIHPELGEVTVEQLLATWVTHDLGHIAQIARVMAKQYKIQVGPWLKYIPILNK